VKPPSPDSESRTPRECRALRLEISGIVQGVGFRPFVFTLAHSLGIRGYVANTSGGVEIHLEGEGGSLKAFERDLTAKAPPLALITGIRRMHPEPGGYTDFTIRSSSRSSRPRTLISPDVSVCKECLAEVRDPGDRRFGYPFTNCTNCGPRYTIVSGIPYDRPLTSMHRFQMCRPCSEEYHDPDNRRFHAQPNACPGCGPRVSLLGPDRREISAADPIAEAASLLREGRVVAVKGLGGFHLAADAENEEAVTRLRERKRREEKPLAVMSPDLERVRLYADPSPEEEALLMSSRRPIVLVPKRDPRPLARAVAPGSVTFGVLLPYTPLHHLLLAHGFTALVMTSANLTEEPICIRNEEALSRLEGIADAFLMHDREILQRCDDSVVRAVDGRTRMIRRSRGYVPAPVFLSRPVSPVLACGAALKNTFCLAEGNNAFLSQHVGDLENLEAYTFFCETVDLLRKILEIDPEIAAHDLHPDYLSTGYAAGLEGVEKVGVQHHHAHVVSCMAEHGLEGPVIGVSADGTGLGTDGNIWGGEVLVAELHAFTRFAYLEYVRMPGGDAAIRNPWRMAASYLLQVLGEGSLDFLARVWPDVPHGELEIVRTLVRRGVHSPLTSSLGRLFDGVAALCGIRSSVAYEGQAAMELEAAADDREAGGYETDLDGSGFPVAAPVAGIVRGVVRDLESGAPVSVVSARFHNAVVSLFQRLCECARTETGINTVVLSGGVFQNARLPTRLPDALQRQGFRVFIHEKVPANDGGICLGQAVAASEMMRRGNG